MQPNRSYVDGRLEVRLLGRVAVKLDGKLLPGFDSPRIQRLLAQISTEDGASRSRLAFELWPDSTDAQARGNLRKLLHDLRRHLPDVDSFLELGQYVVRWKSGPRLSVDLLEFRSAVALGDSEAAAAVYGGDLLPASYDEWVVTERERLRTKALEVFLGLATESLASDADGAVGYARKALAIDGLNESGYRLLIQAHAARGDRAEAVRAYHRCQEILQQELGVEPQAATRAVYENVLAAARPASGAATAAPATPLVARSAELAVALDAWRGACRGEGKLLLIDGEPGIGKTRLAQELARKVAGEGFVVARARCYHGAGSPSWAPVVDWIRSEPLRAGIDRLDPVWILELARLLPELRSGISVPGADPLNEAARHRLLDALIKALFGSDRPILLVIDDLQWCDRETLELIGYALRGDPPALIAGTVRMEEVDDHHPLAPLRLGLARDSKLVELRLGRLDESATAELALRAGAPSLNEQAAQRLWKETEGMPLFVVEAVRTGALSDPSSTALTPTVRAVIAARLAQLSPPARRLAQAAATIGRSFSFEVLQPAAAMDDDALVDALDELWRRRIVREQSGSYDFTHDRIREVAYDGIAPARRRRLHGLIAQALDGDPALAGVVAAHYEQAGMPEEAVGAYLSAGQRAMAVFALRDAISAFRRGLVLLEQLPAGADRDEKELALRSALGVPLVAREGYGSDSVQETYRRAMLLCERLGREVQPEILRGLGLASLMSCRFDASQRYAEGLLRLQAMDPTAATEGHYLLGVGEFWRGDSCTSERHLRLAIECFSAQSAEEHLRRFAQDPKAVCTVRLALTNLWKGRTRSSRRQAAEALAYSRTLNHPTTEGYVRMYTSMLAAERENLAELDAELSAGESIWSEQGLGYFRAVGELLRAWYLFQSGQRAQGRQRLTELVAGWRSQAQTLHFSYGLALLARAHLGAGDVTAGLNVAAEGLRWSADHDQGYLDAEFHRIQGHLLAGDGWNSGAAEALTRAVAVASEQGNWWLALEAAVTAAALAPERAFQKPLEGVLGHFEEAEELPRILRARKILARR